MKKLKTILLSNLFIIFLIIFTLLYVIYYIFYKDYKSLYSENETSISGHIDKYDVKDSNIKITLSGKEKVIVYIDIKYLNEIKFGNYVEINGKFSDINGNYNFNNFDYKKYLNNHKIYRIFYAKEIIKVNKYSGFLYFLKNSIYDRCVNLDKKGYMSTFLLGINDIDRDTYKMFSNIGFVYVFAISGMHIHFIDGFIKKIFNKSKYKDMISLIILFFYIFIIGFVPSILRCYLYILLCSLNKYFNNILSEKKLFIYSIIIMLLINPFYIFDNGFLYSVTCSFGLIFFYKKIDNTILNILYMTLCATIFSLPITINNYYKFNFISFLSNLIIVPLITSIIYPCTFLVFILDFIYPVYDFILYVMETISKILSSISLLNFNFPKMNIYIIILYYIFLLLLFNKNKIGYLFILLLIFYRYIYFFDSSYYLYIFDVGQGDSSLIIYPYRKKVILIDTGGNSNSNYYYVDYVITFLNSLGINKIDDLIITHGDYDHMGDSIYLIDNFKIDNVYFNIGAYNDLENQLIYKLKLYNIPYYRVDSLLDNKFLITREYDNENDNSNVILFNLYNYSFLYMGDAGIDRERDILNKYNLSNIDFIKVGHHGSKTSSSDEFIDKIRPKNCLISVGRNNRYGHPNRDVIDNLNNFCNIYRTDLNGSIEIIINKNDYKIKIYSS